MAFISFKALGLWIHNTILIILLYFVDFQKILEQPNYEELKNKGIFMLFSVYFLSTILLHVYKISIMRTDLKIKKETLKTKQELRKYIENKNKKKLMKILKWFFQFSGLEKIWVIAKVILNLIILALVVGLLYLVYSGFMGAWQYIAQKEPQTKQKIENLYNYYILKHDSLKTAKNQVLILSNESLKKDSVIFDQTELLKNKDSQIIQHQKKQLRFKKATGDLPKR